MILSARDRYTENSVSQDCVTLVPRNERYMASPTATQEEPARPSETAGWRGAAANASNILHLKSRLNAIRGSALRGVPVD